MKTTFTVASILCSLLFSLTFAPSVSATRSAETPKLFRWIHAPAKVADSIEIVEVRHDRLIEGINFLQATVKNRSGKRQVIGLDIRTSPGLWLGNWQQQYVYELKPNERKTIEAAYVFRGLSPYASLRVTFGTPVLQESGFFSVTNHVYRNTFHPDPASGEPDPGILSRFDKMDAGHFQIFIYDNYISQSNKEQIVREREMGLQQIADFFETDYSGTVRLFLFPDEQIKEKVTGHQGLGWAFSNNMIEVYNDAVRLDPYHELTHIVGENIGDPPALFQEGLAVYLTERFGAQALKYLGHPDKTIDEASRMFVENDSFIALETLIAFTQIGSEESKPQTSYAQSGSIVKHLVETYGRDRFLEVYRKLRNGSDEKTKLYNREVLREVYGVSLNELEQAWVTRYR